MKHSVWIALGVPALGALLGLVEDSREALVAPPETVDFENDLIPVFTKAGCNAGGCHGAAIGRGGFKLSLFGGNPEADYEAIVRELSGRRVNLAQPEESLVFLKSTASIQHGGKQALDESGEGAQLLLKWIEEGAPYVRGRRLERVEISPSRFAGEAVGAEVRLRATALYADGTTRDVTQWTVFNAEDSSAVDVNPDTAKVRVLRRGRHIVVARYLDQVLPVEIFVPLREEEVDLSAEPRRNFIDDEVLASLSSLRVPVSGMVDDTTFLRRITLDLTGRLPEADPVEVFLADHSVDKREVLVDELIGSEEFVEFWTLKLAKLLRIHSQGSKDEITVTPAAARLYHGWLQEQIGSNAGYDELARALLLGTGDSLEVGPANFYRTVEDPMAQTEYVTELFMGSRMRCANCHNHPLDKWTQDDYHGLTAIFAKVGREEVVKLSPVGKAIHPVTGKPAVMRIPGERFLDADTDDGRQALADWITSPDNPYFAKAIVNRLWKAMMGRGLVEPVDDFRDTNPASHPALLNRLAEDFVAHGFDLRHTLKRIASSAAYARSADTTAENAADDRFYSHALRKRLEPEVLADAISDVLGVVSRYGDEPTGTRAVALYDASIESDALDILGRCDLKSSPESTPPTVGELPRMLHLFNGGLLNDRLGADGSRLDRLIEEGRSSMDIVSEFYLVALGRHPRDEEQSYWKEQLGEEPSRALLEDFVWSLLICDEFQTNH